MKKLLLSLVLIALTLSNMYGQTIENISGNITSSTTWTANKIYVLNGLVRVQDPAVLTIEAGTIVKGAVPASSADKPGTLIVERGAKLMAEGTESNPIIFTSAEPAGSRTPGDWGGIVLCGKSTINTPSGEFTLEGNYGAVVGGGASPDVNDNSGVLKYIRIEFAGFPIEPNKEINSLTMGAVGAGTTIEHIQVSYANDDAYEWFGGTVNAKYLVAYKTNDDVFDTDYGYNGKVQFGFSISDPNISDLSGANAFESDNDATSTNNTPWTNATFSNITIIGPKQNFNSSLPAGHFWKNGVHLKRNTRLHVFNSIIGGYPTGVYVDGAGVAGNINNNELDFEYNVIFAANGADAAYPTNKSVADAGNISPVVLDVATWFSASNNTEYDNASDIMLMDPYSATAPDARPNSGSPVLSGADFSHSKLDAFFTDVTYKGAFDGTTNWATTWTEWDPQNEPYLTTASVSKAATALASSKVYPNPVSETANVELQLSADSDVKVILSDLMGKEVRSMSISNTRHAEALFDVSDLTKGVYSISYYINGVPAKAELLMVK